MKAIQYVVYAPSLYECNHMKVYVLTLCHVIHTNWKLDQLNALAELSSLWPLFVHFLHFSAVSLWVVTGNVFVSTLIAREPSGSTWSTCSWIGTFWESLCRQPLSELSSLTSNSKLTSVLVFTLPSGILWRLDLGLEQLNALHRKWKNWVLWSSGSCSAYIQFFMKNNIAIDIICNGWYSQNWAEFFRYVFRVNRHNLYR